VSQTLAVGRDELLVDLSAQTADVSEDTATEAGSADPGLSSAAGRQSMVVVFVLAGAENTVAAGMVATGPVVGLSATAAADMELRATAGRSVTAVVATGPAVGLPAAAAADLGLGAAVDRSVSAAAVGTRESTAEGSRAVGETVGETD
jgi:hypothetical protein